ncbi:non-canonical purine NTP pyrophosphatase, rdgB/HAM1 family [Cryptosporangium arvum DSM 44712]|uniref:dITP/XTP pyrophosphatase n=1 Tax=Cryptosporangium arvum DSM 44712 TaxID=927661 RepID=A0A010ZN71_9ACTN|nr:RdgB/HAM1 family non-canonical purine NTP pyrophosphatase [Cryptosporangium arvum]EXG80134.1 non-canonical purine NTP pyrophosphatase, rdgB/HAM1 family [Cryptosporangium arvum DSM 44712]
MSLTRVVLASRNAKKIAELRRILAVAVPQVEVVGLDEVPPYPETVEDGATFAENALLKAREAAEVSGLPAIADDSGIAVDALNGMPGVLSARWAGKPKSDERNLRLVLEQVEDLPDTRLGAAFVCAAALVLPGGEEHVVEGRMEGSLIREPRGTNGFGYDPIFVPSGSVLTSAEMTPADKDAISHRGKAFRSLAEVLATSLTSA